MLEWEQFESESTDRRTQTNECKSCKMWKRRTDFWIDKRNMSSSPREKTEDKKGDETNKLS